MQATHVQHTYTFTHSHRTYRTHTHSKVFRLWRWQPSMHLIRRGSRNPQSFPSLAIFTHLHGHDTTHSRPDIHHFPYIPTTIFHRQCICARGLRIRLIVFTCRTLNCNRPHPALHRQLHTSNLSVSRIQSIYPTCCDHSRSLGLSRVFFLVCLF